MKKTILVLVSLASLVGISSAQAGSFTFAYINTNDCTQAQNMVKLLNSSDVQVEAVCSAYTPGGFTSNDGRVFDYRLSTKVTIAGTLFRGEQIQMNSIATNDCVFFQNEINLLGGTKVGVDAQCSAYSQGGYSTADGQVFDYQLTTTVTLK